MNYSIGRTTKQKPKSDSKLLTTRRFLLCLPIERTKMNSFEYEIRSAILQTQKSFDDSLLMPFEMEFSYLYLKRTFNFNIYSSISNIRANSISCEIHKIESMITQSSFDCLHFSFLSLYISDLAKDGKDGRAECRIWKSKHWRVFMLRFWNKHWRRIERDLEDMCSDPEKSFFLFSLKGHFLSFGKVTRTSRKKIAFSVVI